MPLWIHISWRKFSVHFKYFSTVLYNKLKLKDTYSNKYMIKRIWYGFFLPKGWYESMITDSITYESSHVKSYKNEVFVKIEISGLCCRVYYRVNYVYTIHYFRLKFALPVHIFNRFWKSISFWSPGSRWPALLDIFSFIGEFYSPGAHRKLFKLIYIVQKW